MRCFFVRGMCQTRGVYWRGTCNVNFTPKEGDIHQKLQRQGIYQIIYGTWYEVHYVVLDVVVFTWRSIFVQALLFLLQGSTSLQSETPSTRTTTATTITTAAPVTLSCSDEDMQAFRADSFVLGKIPECPPPLELC